MATFKFHPERTRQALINFQFRDLFVNELGWSNPERQGLQKLELDDVTYQYIEVAQLAGAKIYHFWKPRNGSDIDAGKRDDLMKKAPELVAQKVVIFTDFEHPKDIQWCNWVWLKTQDSKQVRREHLYTKGQTGDLFLSRLTKLHVDLSSTGLANISVKGAPTISEVANTIASALDIDKVTKKFYKDYQQQFEEFASLITGLDKEADRRWYAAVLLNRLMFIFFLQQKGFVDGGKRQYLSDKLREVQEANGDGYFYSYFLKTLFFEGFAKEADQRTPEVKQLIGNIVYLNGGLFARHRFEDEVEYPNVQIPDRAFALLISDSPLDSERGLFNRYTWSLNDVPGAKDDEINPSVLGYIFEKYINQKEFGAYYTRPEITEYLCEQTINQIILDKINDSPDSHLVPALHGKTRRYNDIGELYRKMDDGAIKRLILGPKAILRNLSLLDPSCGSGAFLVAALKVLVDTYSVIYGKAKFSNDKDLKAYFVDIESKHPSLNYYIKKQIISNNLYGVDIMEEATEIAKLRLFLALVSAATKVTELEPLPNIDFNIMCGNSLIGLLGVNVDDYNERSKSHKPDAVNIQPTQLNVIGPTAVQTTIFNAKGKADANRGFRTFLELLNEKDREIELYRNAVGDPYVLKALKDRINQKRAEANEELDAMLLADMQNQGVKYTQSTWDEAKQDYGRNTLHELQPKHITTLQPFHWGYEFGNIMHKGGFDAIITNPPWEVVKPQSKEFFARYSDLVTKNKMSIKDFEEAYGELMQDEEIQQAWLTYLSEYPYQSAWYRSAPQFQHQSSTVNGKKTGSDINLYKLFLEQCYRLIRPTGYCGIVIPSGIYTDLGAKGLRELLFKQTRITGLFCFENRKTIFENVDSRFKFVVLSFQKGGTTSSFPAAFMRHDVEELERFPRDGAMEITLGFVRLQSPDSLSVMELKSPIELQIAEKMLAFPKLGGPKWGVKLTREFDMTNNANLFRTSPGPGRLPFVTGRNFNIFELSTKEIRYYIEKEDGDSRLRKGRDKSVLSSENYRWVFRRIARNTDSRTLINAILPIGYYSEVNGIDLNASVIDNKKQVYLCGVASSYCCDYLLRLSVTTTLNAFYVYALPLPDRLDSRVVVLACKLICTTPAYADLWQEVMGTPWSLDQVATQETVRNQLRAQLDAQVAHLYGLTEDEFVYILSTFPLVDSAQMLATQNAFRDLVRGGG